MTLTQSYIKSQYITLAPQIRRTLDEIEDPSLAERTLIYRNLLSISTNGNKVMSDTATIAETIVDILDTQAWLDFVDVDGQRKSCESFSKFLEKNRFDIKLAEFAIKEKRNDMHGKFLEARDGSFVASPADRQKLSVLSKHMNMSASSAAKPKKQRRATTSVWRLRLEREAESDEHKQQLLNEVINGRAITSVAVQLGWHPSEFEARTSSILKRLAPQAKPIIKKLGIPPEDFIKLALEEYIQNHYPETTT